MLYVIRKLGTDKCVARFGGEHSYTNNLQQAQTFPTRESAQAQSCGNEPLEYAFDDRSHA
jgi:hypothetical protein